MNEINELIRGIQDRKVEIDRAVGVYPGIAEWLERCQEKDQDRIREIEAESNNP